MLIRVNESLNSMSYGRHSVFARIVVTFINLSPWCIATIVEGRNSIVIVINVQGSPLYVKVYVSIFKIVARGRETKCPFLVVVVTVVIT